MENNTPVQGMENTGRGNESFGDGLHLRESSREEWESRRIDADRFDHPEDYMSEESLKYFRSEENRKKFVAMFWNQH